MGGYLGGYVIFEAVGEKPCGSVSLPGMIKGQDKIAGMTKKT